MMQWLTSRVNLWVVLAGILIAGGLIVLFGLLIVFLPMPKQQTNSPQTVLTMIYAPSPTPSPTLPVFTPTPTNPPSVGGISIGTYVQITGTGGEGLRLHSAPGTSSSLLFIGMDEEVFRIKDGPKVADGFTWWYMEAPYDPSRVGWAASKYLKVVSPPITPTP